MMKILKCVHNAKALRLTDFTSREIVVVLTDPAACGAPWFGVGTESNLEITENVCPLSELMSFFWRRTAF